MPRAASAASSITRRTRSSPARWRFQASPISRGGWSSSGRNRRPLSLEAPEVWLKKLKSDGVPVVFVFNRAGQIERKWTEAPKAEEIDELIEKLLAVKGTP